MDAPRGLGRPGWLGGPRGSPAGSLSRQGSQRLAAETPIELSGVVLITHQGFYLLRESGISGNTLRIIRVKTWRATGSRTTTSRNRAGGAGSAGGLVFVHPGFGEPASERAVTLEEVGEHRGGGEEGADQNRPPRQLVEHPLGQDHDRAEEEHLERGEENDEREDEQRLPLGAGDEQQAEQSDHDEREAVNNRE